MEDGKAQSGWGGARPPPHYRAVVSAELYEEMGAGGWLVVEAAGPEVLKGPRELSAVASCGSCVRPGGSRRGRECWSEKGDRALLGQAR